MPTHAYTTVLHLERRLSRDGMVSVEGNAYSVPDTMMGRSVEVHRLAEELRFYDRGQLVAVHPLLEGRGLRRVADGHRTWPPPGKASTGHSDRLQLEPLGLPGERIVERSLAVYETLGKALAREHAPKREHS